VLSDWVLWFSYVGGIGKALGRARKSLRVSSGFFRNCIDACYRPDTLAVVAVVGEREGGRIYQAQDDC